MKVIILGCGRVGADLSDTLEREGNQVTVIDLNPKAFHRLKKNFNGTKIVGHGFDREVLLGAGIEEADSFVSVTNGDNTNIVAARIARDEFRVPKVITRIYDPRRAHIYRRLGIPTVASTEWAANKIKDLIMHPDFDAFMSLGGGEVELVRVEVPQKLIGKTVTEVSIAGEIEVFSITRMGKAFIPISGTVFEESDVARVAVARIALSQFEQFFKNIGQ